MYQIIAKKNVSCKYFRQLCIEILQMFQIKKFKLLCKLIVQTLEIEKLQRN